MQYYKRNITTVILFCFVFGDTSSFLCLFFLGACQHRQRDVFRPAGSRRLRRLLQPPGRPRPLLHHSLQLLWGDQRRDVGPDPEGHLVPPGGATAAYCVELLPVLQRRARSASHGTLNTIFLERRFVRRLVLQMNVFVVFGHTALNSWVQCKNHFKDLKASCGACDY